MGEPVDRQGAQPSARVSTDTHPRIRHITEKQIDTLIDKFDRTYGNCHFSELYFGLVRTLGTRTTSVISTICDHMSCAGYKVETIKLSDFIAPGKDFASLIDRYETLMDMGDDLRRKYCSHLQYSGSVLALRAVEKISISRAEHLQAAQGMRDGAKFAWILDGLMHPDEVKALRNIYGSRLFVISCDSPLYRRMNDLSNKILEESGHDPEEAELGALRLIYRNSGLSDPTAPYDPGPPRGNPKQHPQDPTTTNSESANCRVATEKAFELGDLFIRCDEINKSAKLLEKMMQCILSHPFHTPSLDEIGMGIAFQVSLASASLSRRVGAVLMKDEQVISVGYNEVPKVGGGVYHSECDPDGREFVQGEDPSDRTREEILIDTLKRLQTLFPQWFKKPESNTSDANIPTDGNSDDELEQVLQTALNSDVIRKGKLFDIIEYGRAAHAEIVAITSAARRGVSTQGSILYCTTMPCHECTRAIVASGISRVVYLEPYRKSRGPTLQADAVALSRLHGDQLNKISIERFAGISYTRFHDLYSFLPRKQADIKEPNTPGKTASTPQGAGTAAGWSLASAEFRETLQSDNSDTVDCLVRKVRERYVIRQYEKAIESLEKESRQEASALE